MVLATARNRGRTLELDIPLELQEGTRVLITVSTPAVDEVQEIDEWTDIGMSRLEEAWDHPGDSIYDNWRELYGLPTR